MYQMENETKRLESEVRYFERLREVIATLRRVEYVFSRTKTSITEMAKAFEALNIKPLEDLYLKKEKSVVELREEAALLGIEGYQSMSKSRLKIELARYNRGFSESLEDLGCSGTDRIIRDTLKSLEQLEPDPDTLSGRAKETN